MSKYYKLYLNNNQNEDCCDFELEGVIRETILIQQNKKKFFGSKTDMIITERFVKTTVIGEMVNGRMIDLVTGFVCELSQKTKMTNAGFEIPVEERNCIYPYLSYYKKVEMEPREVAKILRKYKEEDIKRYREKLLKIDELSLINYNHNIELHKEEVAQNVEAEKYIRDFKARCRK